MITETLGRNASETLALRRYFQTQLLKVVFTTLYVDVKEPAPNFFGLNFSDILGDKKTQLCLPTRFTFPLSRRDKIELNLQSQDIQEHIPLGLRFWGPVSCGVSKIAQSPGPSTQFLQKSETFLSQSAFSVDGRGGPCGRA